MIRIRTLPQSVPWYCFALPFNFNLQAYFRFCAWRRQLRLLDREGKAFSMNICQHQTSS